MKPCYKYGYHQITAAIIHVRERICPRRERVLVRLPRIANDAFCKRHHPTVVNLDTLCTPSWVHNTPDMETELRIHGPPASTAHSLVSPNDQLPFLFVPLYLTIHLDCSHSF
jgi:hypothetical protein